METKKKHEPYYAIPAYQILAKETNESVARKLGITPRTYWNKVQGYSDFTAEQGQALAAIFGVSLSQIFLV